MWSILGAVNPGGGQSWGQSTVGVGRAHAIVAVEAFYASVSGPAAIETPSGPPPLTSGPLQALRTLRAQTTQSGTVRRSSRMSDPSWRLAGSGSRNRRASPLAVHRQFIAPIRIRLRRAAAPLNPFERTAARRRQREFCGTVFAIVSSPGRIFPPSRLCANLRQFKRARKFGTGETRHCLGDRHF
jgi:hypothetical protein